MRSTYYMSGEEIDITVAALEHEIQERRDCMIAATKTGDANIIDHRAEELVKAVRLRRNLWGDDK